MKQVLIFFVIIFCSLCGFGQARDTMVTGKTIPVNAILANNGRGGWDTLAWFEPRDYYVGNYYNKTYIDSALAAAAGMSIGGNVAGSFDQGILYISGTALAENPSFTTDGISTLNAPGVQANGANYTYGDWSGGNNGTGLRVLDNNQEIQLLCNNLRNGIDFANLFALTGIRIFNLQDKDYTGVADITDIVNADWNSEAGGSQILNKPNVAVTVAATDTTTISGGATIVTYTTPTGTDGTYRVGGYLTITAVSLDVINFRVGWTDETNNARLQTYYPMGSTSPSLASAGSTPFAPIDLRVKANTTITVSTTLTTGTGSITYDCGASIIKIK